MQEVGEVGIHVLFSKGSRGKIRLLVCLLSSTEPALTKGLRQTCGKAGMRLTGRPSVECSAPRTCSHYSTFGAKFCVISMGPASLDLLLCVLVCFGSRHYWEITAHF